MATKKKSRRTLAECEKEIRRLERREAELNKKVIELSEQVDYYKDQNLVLKAKTDSLASYGWNEEKALFFRNLQSFQKSLTQVLGSVDQHVEASTIPAPDLLLFKVMTLAREYNYLRDPRKEKQVVDGSNES